MNTHMMIFVAAMKRDATPRWTGVQKRARSASGERERNLTMQST
jgi:hypothetical protein